MIVYVSDKLGFKADVVSNRIEEINLASFVSRRDRSLGLSEVRARKIRGVVYSKERKTNHAAKTVGISKSD